LNLEDESLLLKARSRNESLEREKKERRLAFLADTPERKLLKMKKLFFLSLYDSTAHWTLAAFQILNPIHSYKDSLDGGSARRKTPT
jgi:hypothetical protein